MQAANPNSRNLAVQLQNRQGKIAKAKAILRSLPAMPAPIVTRLRRNVLARAGGESRYNAAQLIAIRDAAIILAPCGPLSAPEEIRAGDMVVNADPGPCRRLKDSSTM
jgi:hypothetical protein